MITLDLQHNPNKCRIPDVQVRFSSVGGRLHTRSFLLQRALFTVRNVLASCLAVGCRANRLLLGMRRRLQGETTAAGVPVYDILLCGPRNRFATPFFIAHNCGYSMGPRKFAETAPFLTGGEYAPTLRDAEKAVELYRESNKPVVQLWDALHRGMQTSLGSTYEVELPSGRTLRYFGVRRIGDKYTATKELGGTADYFYGGKLTENATQALARDVFAAALLRVHDSGVGRIVWHVHDEVIVEVPEERAEAAAEEVRKLMCIPPDWCKELPLDAEASVSKHYCK